MNAVNNVNRRVKNIAKYAAKLLLSPTRDNRAKTSPPRERVAHRINPNQGLDVANLSNVFEKNRAM